MVELKTSSIALVIDPSRGGTIISLQSLLFHDEWIFFDASRRPPNALLENYDDVWCGGFEELFPNDSPGTFFGRNLRDHGELWQKGWEIINQSTSGISLEVQCETVPSVVKKTISLATHFPEIRIDYELRNTSDTTYPYLFKLHPAMRIESGDQILLPDGDILPVDLEFSKIIGKQGPFTWPKVISPSGASVDISIIPGKESNLQEFVYVKNISKGWCGLKRSITGETLMLHYPLAIFPYCWLFMAFGGWKNYYTAVIEPCTNFPKDMNVASKNGTCAIMRPYEARTFSINISLI